MAVLRRFLLPPAGSFFLFGPRGTGKSTWLAQVFPEAIRLDLLASDVLRTYQARPERLRERLAAEPEAELLLLSLCEGPLLIDGIGCLPLASWLRELRP
jgi:hypothetical protein